MLENRQDKTISMESEKPIHSLILDAGGIIKNEPPVSTLLSKSTTLVTVPAIISEIKDSATRSRVQTTLQPFLTLRTPSTASIKVVTDFARRTGDFRVLSNPDVQIIALAYELECERNGGDWRLRSVPGQRRVNGAPPPAATGEVGGGESAFEARAPDGAAEERETSQELEAAEPTIGQHLVLNEPKPSEHGATADRQRDTELAESVTQLNVLGDVAEDQTEPESKVDSVQNSAGSQDDSDELDSGGWITPSNLKKKQAEDANASTTQTPEPKVMQVAVLTTDFAMQNVILQMNLNLLSPSLTRVKHVKTFVLRCHACFQVTKDMNKQFCPRCGQPSLSRVSCSTSANGEYKLHLKKNMQWNSRGDRYSIPKPVHGSANGKVKGGGKGGWGNGLVLAEDQKEYQRAAQVEKKQRERNLMDEDYLPSILTGDRSRSGSGRIKVGAGRNVNARKR